MALTEKIVFVGNVKLQGFKMGTVIHNSPHCLGFEVKHMEKRSNRERLKYLGSHP
jgi:hypothetical protein